MSKLLNYLLSGMVVAMPLTVSAQTDAQAPASSNAACHLPEQLTLEDALQLALQHNQTLMIARERVREQQGVVVEVRSARRPNLDLSAGYSVVDRDLMASAPGFSQNNESWDAGIQISYAIYTGGAVSSNLQAQRLLERAAEATVRSTVEDVLLQVKQSYYDALLALERIAVREEAVTLFEEQLRTANARYESGAGAQFDVLRASVSLANAKPPLARARNDYRLAVDQLRQAIGLPLNSEDAMGGPELVSPWNLNAVGIDLAAALRRAENQRADLSRLSLQAEAAAEAVDAAKAGRRPTLNAFAGYGVQNDSFSNDLDRVNDGWRLGIQGNWSLYDGGSTAGQLIQARARQRQIAQQFEAQDLAIKVQVRDAFSRLTEAAEILETSELVIDQAQEALRLANERFRAGVATQLDVLESQLDLTEARLEHAQASHDYSLALARLAWAMGGE